MRLLAVAVALAACGDDFVPPVDAIDPSALTDEERLLLSSMALTAPPPDVTNRFADDHRAARLGQKLFFDKSYSGPLAIGDNGQNGGVGAAGERGKVSCHSCHSVASADLDDRRSQPNNVSLGTDYGTRNALGLTNSAHYRWTNWGGRFDSQWSLPLAVAENARIMNSTRLDVFHMIATKYRSEYETAFGSVFGAFPDPTGLPLTGKPGVAEYDALTVEQKRTIDTVFVNYGKALQAYIRRLESHSAFDRFAAGDDTAVSEEARRGFKVFVSANCVACHSGPNLADDEFHALGVPQRGDHVPPMDLGRYQDVPALLASPFNSNGAFSDNTSTGRLDGLAQSDAQKGQFRTKSLRNAPLSGPYMHDGAFSVLEDVIAFYEQGGGEVADGVTLDPEIVPLELDANDKRFLLAFLETLRGAPPPEAWLVDTSK